MKPILDDDDDDDDDMACKWLYYANICLDILKMTPAEFPSSQGLQ
jgi:hypothetical protein